MSKQRVKLGNCAHVRVCAWVICSNIKRQHRRSILSITKPKLGIRNRTTT